MADEAPDRRGKLIKNPELIAMDGIDGILRDLDEAQADRVLRYTVEMWATEGLDPMRFFPKPIEHEG